MHPLSAFDLADAELLTILAYWEAFLLAGFVALGALWVRFRMGRKS